MASSVYPALKLVLLTTTSPQLWAAGFFELKVLLPSSANDQETAHNRTSGDSEDKNRGRGPDDNHPVDQRSRI